MQSATGQRDPSGDPGERESNAGMIAGTAWILGLVLGGGSYSLTSGNLQLVLAAIFGTVWVVAGVWWIWLFLGRMRRSYQYGKTG